MKGEVSGCILGESSDLTKQQQLLLEQQQSQRSLRVLGVLGVGHDGGIGRHRDDALVVDGGQGEGDGQHQGEHAKLQGDEKKTIIFRKFLNQVSAS